MPRPDNEALRLAALRRYDIMDTPPEPGFDRLARLCATLFAVPIAMVSVIDEERQFFKACVGTTLTGNSRELALCSYTIVLDGPQDVLVVPDASQDPRFMHNPVVTAAGIRFYAGTPLRSSDGYAIGTLCIYDVEPRHTFSSADSQLLSELAAIAASELERRQAETQLRAAAEQLARQQRDFELALTKARMAVWSIDLPGGALSVHADFEALGLAAAQLPTHYQELGQVLHLGDPGKLSSGIEEIIAQGSDFEAHYRLLPHQPPRWIGVRGSVEHDAQGRAVRLLGVAYDVTDERRALQAQRESERTLRAIIEHTDDRITLKDMQGRFVLVNPAAARLFGRAPDDLVGLSEPELLGQPPLPALSAAEQTVLDTGAVQTYEQTFGRSGAGRDVQQARGGPPPGPVKREPEPNESRVWLTTTFPYVVGNGVRRGVISVSRDITERKRTEDVLRGANLSLERLVEARTERLSEINSELTAFAASMSADVREPLRRLEGYLELVSGRAALHGDLDAQRYLDTMKRESHRVTLLLQDLSEYARSGRRELQINRVALGPLLMQVRSDLEPLFRDRQVRWEVGALPTVLGDQMLLRQALTNVLHNALKFSRERPETHLKIDSWAEAGEVVVRVRDNGTGFLQADAPRLFHVFTRLHDGRFEGAGVGLANVRRVMVRHGGRCWAEGQPGQGASVYLALPQLPTDAELK